MIYTSKAFWVDTAERTIRTGAQTLLGSLGATTIITGVDWPVALATAGLACVACVLTCIAMPKTGANGG